MSSYLVHFRQPCPYISVVVRATSSGTAEAYTRHKLGLKRSKIVRVEYLASE